MFVQACVCMIITFKGNYYPHACAICTDGSCSLIYLILEPYLPQRDFFFPVHIVFACLLIYTGITTKYYCTMVVQFELKYICALYFARWNLIEHQQWLFGAFNFPTLS